MDLACGILAVVDIYDLGGRGFSLSPKESSRGKLMMSGQYHCSVLDGDKNSLTDSTRGGQRINESV